ncbi:MULTISPECIES: fructose-6-phosphate aldolase [unclassified Phenylobacterium]|uniref:fructose-6-phosphate aldolase n=1 Tax=unclassified Phenylobacterium TaxID=2640670 RepID=UPI001B4851A2|nr:MULTISPECIES: fructose-6-phosphate aldolase [unclassified Phenylobacterium]MBP7701042.1 fructose-6-phosphate aldolase [Phenylobacterium sp.]MBS0489928.1 fructose-6-phosphate aldolase [Pseudomonadota bacterium]MCX7586581.1 fructose-6-phosphate aldolase [Phenylobacterium sp. 58.2.17]WGU40061.1 fructose-6-phosphate aldolase [Phenylobacterium sp. NIBR 498073]
MQLFLDTTDIGLLKELTATGLVDGVTTNPTLIAKSGRPMLEVIAEICELVEGPVSAEVAATEVEGMLAEGAKLAAIAPNVVVKLPLTRNGLIATAEFAVQGIQTNVTLCFTAAQALLAAKAGASYISPFIGRLDDYGAEGMTLIEEIRAIYDNYGFDTEILAASIRTPAHVTAAALAGADCATIPPTTFADLFKHPLTEKGLEQFLSDWAKTGQSIL